MMHMSFWFGYDIGDFFFSGLKIDSSLKLVGLCITLTTLSILYEGLKVHVAKSKAIAARERNRAPTNSESPLLNIIGPSPARLTAERAIKVLKEAGFFLFQNALGYALMLTVMIYNGYLFLSVVGGMFIGYLIFGHISMKINMENVRAVQNRAICSSRCADEANSTTSTLRSVSESRLPANTYGASTSSH